MVKTINIKVKVNLQGMLLKQSEQTCHQLYWVPDDSDDDDDDDDDNEKEDEDEEEEDGNASEGDGNGEDD